MYCRVITDHERIIYRLLDITGIAEEQLKAMYYTCNGEYWEKSLPLSALMYRPDVAVLEANYNGFLEREFGTGRTLDDFEAALLTIVRKHQEAGIRWWLTGSAALYIRGLEVRPHDIDIMTYLAEAGKVTELWRGDTVEPFHYPQGWVVKGFGVVDIGYRVDIAFEPEAWVDGQGALDFGPYAEQHLETISWKGYAFQVPPLALHLPSNQARNRTDIVRQLHDRL